MNRKESLLHLRENSLWEFRVEQIAALHTHLVDHRMELVSDVVTAFQEICAHALKMQASCQKGKAQYIHFTFFRHRVLSRNPRCRINVYDHQGYADPVECSTEYDASWVFNYLDAFEDQIRQAGKRYVNKIHSADISLIKREEAALYVHYLTNLVRHAMKEAVETDEFAALAKEEELYIRVGEYKDANELVFKYNGKKQDSDQIRKALSPNEQDHYVHENFRGVDLSGMVFKLVDLCYCYFTNSSLIGSYLVGCPLIGADFRHSDLTEAILEQSLINGADFRGANLRKAKLESVQGSFVVPERSAFHIPPFMATSFEGANLEETSFDSSDLRGADFRRAILNGTNFAQASLEGARFLKTDIGGLNLNDQQLATIQLCSE